MCYNFLQLCSNYPDTMTQTYLICKDDTLSDLVNLFVSDNPRLEPGNSPLEQSEDHHSTQGSIFCQKYPQTTEWKPSTEINDCQELNNRSVKLLDLSAVAWRRMQIRFQRPHQRRPKKYSRRFL